MSTRSSTTALIIAFCGGIPGAYAADLAATLAPPKPGSDGGGAGKSKPPPATEDSERQDGKRKSPKPPAGPETDDGYLEDQKERS